MEQPQVTSWEGGIDYALWALKRARKGCPHLSLCNASWEVRWYRQGLLPSALATPEAVGGYRLVYETLRRAVWLANDDAQHLRRLSGNMSGERKNQLLSLKIDLTPMPSYTSLAYIKRNGNFK